MSLFDTPSLSIPKINLSNVDQSSAAAPSRKRKRGVGTDGQEKAVQVEINLEKLIKKMGDLERKGKKDGKDQLGVKEKKGVVMKETGKGNGKKGIDNEPVIVKGKATDNTAGQGKKAWEKDTQGKGGITRKQPIDQPPQNKVKPPAKPTSSPLKNIPQASSTPLTFAASSSSEPTTSLQQKMRSKLSGARFRWINEKLYTCTGREGLQMMQDDRTMFDEYHQGFRTQTSLWPVSPVSRLTDSLASLPPSTLIVDFGCGDATLAKTLAPKGFKVLSLDLVADEQGWVVQCECSNRVPLPGGGEGGAEGIVDVVVCCLSLMGMDWTGMIKEARRILRFGGQLKIAEVTSRFTDLKAFITLVKALGFKMTMKDDSNSHFIVFDFSKSTRDSSAAGASDLGKMEEKSGTLLKPCVYKKR